MLTDWCRLIAGGYCRAAIVLSAGSIIPIEPDFSRPHKPPRLPILPRSLVVLANIARSQRRFGAETLPPRFSQPRFPLRYPFSLSKAPNVLVPATVHQESTFIPIQTVGRCAHGLSHVCGTDRPMRTKAGPFCDALDARRLVNRAITGLGITHSCTRDTHRSHRACSFTRCGTLFSSSAPADRLDPSCISVRSSRERADGCSYR